jgi:multiple antibiotic resistance protein
MIDYFTSALVTLLVTVDPPGLAPLFLGVTPGMSGAERRQVAIRAVIIAFAIMAASGLVGAQLLGALGIGLPAFRTAGGLLLFWIAFEMVFGRRNDRKSEQATTAITIDHIRNVAAFPLAIPLMAGPGALTATILLAGRAEGDLLRLAVLMAVIAGVACGMIPLRAFLITIGVVSGVTVFNQIRTLVAHLWENDGEPLSVTGQYLDSVNVPPPGLLPALWAPVGLRYHALHHLLPGVPYHALGEAHARLTASLPATSAYHQGNYPNLFGLVVRLVKGAKA